MNIHESAEDYLEKILMLQEQKGSVRSIDLPRIYRWTRGWSGDWYDPGCCRQRCKVEHDLSEEITR